MGKLANEELQKMLNCIRADNRVMVPPMIGYDAGVHRLGDKYVVVSTDPCTGVPPDWFGWLMINYAASDVALSGSNPQFCTITLLGPRSTDSSHFQRVMAQACKAADELNIAIVRGHTGTYDSLKDLLGVCTVYGTVNPKMLITSGGAKAGDLLLCTKLVGLETLTNFSISKAALAKRIFGIQKQKELASLVPLQSCVKEARQLSKIRGIHAMHDATEGGFVAALNELSHASKVGFRLYWEKLPLTKEFLILRDYFGLSYEQLLAMSSTGTILASVAPSAQKKVEVALKKSGHSAYFLGEFTENQERVIIREGKETKFPIVAEDPYAIILSGK